MTLVVRLNELLWETLPRAAVRRWPTLGSVLEDGSYLASRPIVGVAAPLAALAIGFVIGAFRFFGDETYTFAIVYVLLLAIPACFGAALGLLTAIGFAIGDFVLFPHVFLVHGIVGHLWEEQVPLLISYVALAGLTVLLPIGARNLPASIVRLYDRRFADRTIAISYVILGAATAAFLAAGWSASAQVLTRPLESFRGGFPSPQVVQPLRTQGVLLIALAGVLTGIRLSFEVRLHRTPWRPVPGRTGVPQDRHVDVRGQVLRAAVVSAFLTLALAGLLDELWQGAVLFGALFVSTLLRSVLLPRIPRYASALQRVPVLLRILALSAIGYGVGLVVLPLLVDNPPFLGQSWTPMVIVASISLVIAALLLPSPPIRPRGEAAA